MWDRNGQEEEAENFQIMLIIVVIRIIATAAITESYHQTFLES
jgi:hypothetical protein